MKGFGKNFKLRIREEDKEWLEQYSIRNIGACEAKLRKLKLKAKRDLQERVF